MVSLSCAVGNHVKDRITAVATSKSSRSRSNIHSTPILDRLRPMAPTSSTAALLRRSGYLALSIVLGLSKFKIRRSDIQTGGLSGRELRAAAVAGLPLGCLVSWPSVEHHS